jgi:hypothetical protein
MGNGMREAVHPEPVWRDRANFVIASAVDPSGTDVATEQLWVRKIGARCFELCCIPFFVYDLALGDVVETDDNYLVQRVVTHSGRYTFRVSFGHSRQWREEVIAQLEELGSMLEWSSVNMVAVDAVDKQHAQRIADFLHGREQRGDLIYETGRTA